MMPRGGTAHLLTPDIPTHEGWMGTLARLSTGTVRARAVWTPPPPGLSVSACRLSIRESLQRSVRSRALRALTVSTRMTGPSIWMPILLIHPKNPSSRCCPVEGHWFLFVSTVTPQDTHHLMMEDTLHPDMMCLDPWAPLGRILQAGMRVAVLDIMMIRPCLTDLRALAGLMVAGHPRDLMDLGGVMAPSCLMDQWEAEKEWVGLMVHLTLKALGGLMVLLVSSPH